MKMTEQLTWAELAEWYEEEYGESVHPQTLRQALIRDGSVLRIHERASKQVRHALEHVWDQVDILRLITFAFNGKFTEWSLIYEKVMQSYVDEQTFVTDEQVQRMDVLWNDLTSFFMRALEVMKDLKGGNAAIPELEILLRSSSATVGITVEDGALNSQVLTDLIASVAEKTAKMLDGVHSKHRKEGHGFYRTIDAAEEDLMEVDV
jgi:hypothetical protein